MPHSVNFAPIALLMFLAGIGIPIMASFNSALGVQLGSPVAATFAAFAIGLALLGLLLAIIGLPPRSAFTLQRPHLYTGAVFIAFYAVSIAWAAPKMGVGNAVFFVLLGQLVAATVIDHYGLWGAAKAEVTGRRLAGLGFMALGVFLARKPV